MDASTSGQKSQEHRVVGKPRKRQVDPDVARVRAKIAAQSRWSDPAARVEQSEASRRALRERFARKVDPDGELSPDERAKLVDSAIRAHVNRMVAARLNKTRRKRSR